MPWERWSGCHQPCQLVNSLRHSDNPIHLCRCDNGNAGSGSFPVQVTYDNAAVNPINVASDKTILGVGSKGGLKGKGLRMANGAKNVIIQNIYITDLNPQYASLPSRLIELNTRLQVHLGRRCVHLGRYGQRLD